jgi:AraC-like DNA-binding protein
LARAGVESEIQISSAGKMCRHVREYTVSDVSARKPVKWVAIELFYKQVSHFCRKFKECHGLSPQAWRRAQSQ